MAVKYIMPDWDDYLDADFDFQNDEFSVNEAGRNLQYLHEMMGSQTPYDGILVSLNQIDKKKGALKKHAITPISQSIRDMMRIPANLQVIGDCGAYSYKDQNTPPVQSALAAKLYQRYDFDVGASVDHMVVDEIVLDKPNGGKRPLSDEEKSARVLLTVKNAESFIEEVQRRQYSFTPLGSVQARTAQEYADIFERYIRMGYRQVALGTLIPKDDEHIREIIETVGERYRNLSEQVRKDVKIHLFGILRPSLFPIYAANGVSSFDSASYFRKAWLQSDKNYLSANGMDWYAAIRVRQSAFWRNHKILEERNQNFDEVRREETELLRELSAFDRTSSINALLERISNYDSYYDPNGTPPKLRAAYERALTERPWEQCPCQICRQIGIHALIFRGYNRNKRRGFHNTYVFYHHYNGGAQYEGH